MNLLDIDRLTWVHHTGDDSGGPTIDYWGTILDIRDPGHIELLYRWEPMSHCHFHRHRAHTTSIILEGELHVADYVDGKATESRVRPAGHRAHGGGDEVHREWGGPAGALVYFSIYTEDGILVEQLNEQGETLRTVTLEDLKKTYRKQLAKSQGA